MAKRFVRILGLAALVALAATLVIWEFGGGSVRLAGLRVSARSWDRPFLVALATGAAFIYFGGRPIAEQWISQIRRRFRPAIAVGILCVAAAASSFFLGTHVASGSDPYGYMSQADLWRRGALEQPQVFAHDVSWPDAQWSFTPLGYRPSVSGQGIVPTYPAGYPLLLAAGQVLAGQAGALLIVPLCFALAIWATYRLGELVSSPMCGFVAASLLAVSPAVSYMALWTMSDIPALALWTLCLATVLKPSRRAPLIAGLFAAVAILIRPNLFPAAGVIALWLFFERLPMRQRVMRVAEFVLAAIPGIAVTALINARLFGSPLRSGYGGLDQLFAFANVRVNLGHWLSWLTMSESWFVFLAFVPLILPLRKWWLTRDNRALALLGPFVLAIVVMYIAYEPFNAWWYLRFLLPAFPPLMVGAGIVATRMAGDRAWRTLAAVALTLLFGLHLLHRSMDLLGSPSPKTLEARYYNIAKFADAKTPPNAVFLSQQHSGSLRYYAHRLTMRFDYLNEDRIPDVLAWCRERGVHPYVIVEEWELAIFRKRFPNWSKALEPSLVYGYGGAQQVFIYDALATGEPFEKIPAGPVPLVPQPMPGRNIALR